MCRNTLKLVVTFAFCLVLALVFTRAAKAEIVEQKVEYKDGETPLLGYFFFDNMIAETRPTVIVFSDWLGVGDFAKERARQLRSMGYNAFIADTYGNGKFTSDPKEAAALSTGFKQNRGLTRSRAKAALSWLSKHPKVDPKRIGAIGFCFGGMVALELVRSGAELDGIVSFHGTLETPEESKLKTTASKILILHGAEDPLVPAAEVAGFEEEMRKAAANWELVKYGGAVHSFTNPQAGSDVSKGFAYNPQVSRRAYEAMQDFFKEILQ